MDKDIRDIVAAAEDQGFTVTYSGKGYPLVFRDARPEQGEPGDLIFVTKLPQTPSDPRSLKNSLAPLKRAGFVLPGTDGGSKKGKARKG